MICSNCGTSNPEGASFCIQCGNSLEKNCPKCQQPNPPVARFCMHCGFSLSQAVPATGRQPDAPGVAARPAEPDQGSPDWARETAPGRLGPAAGAARRAARPAVGGRLEGERRVVTILFCDVKGSTSLAESLDPEEWAEIMNEAFGYLIRPVYRYAGNVARLMGDAILAFFGAPVAHEDDPQRAILAGLEIVSGIREFHEWVRRRRGLEFDVRVGIHTGLVVVGEIGNDLAMEYTAMGDAVNLAARIEQTAEPGSVLISEDTYRLVAPLFEVEALGELELRGKRLPVPVLRVLGLKDHPGRLRGLSDLAAPLVGREAEMRLLRRAADRVRRGQGSIVCLTGEAGLGKSRLIEELRQSWQASASAGFPTWREGRLLTHTSAQPYAAFQALVRSLCAVDPSDGTEAIQNKLVCGCLPGSLPDERCARVSRVFQVLLGVQPPSVAPLEGEAFKRELFEAMLNTWDAWAAQAPLVLVFDDLQWADPASLELLQHLFQLAARAPVLFLCAFRPERLAPVWNLRAIVSQEYPDLYQEIALSSLNETDSGQLASSLLNLELPQELLRMILSRAEGNPFYLEEVVRALIESGVIVRDESGAAPGDWRVEQNVTELTIPDNIQTLVMARIDRLSEAARYVLQVAAVIGRTFNRRVLERVLAGSHLLDQQLELLKSADLIYESAHNPEVEYTFRHALTHETVYNTILLKRRKLFHLLVGESLETLYAGRSDEFAAILAHHFHEGGDPRAIGYFIQAAERAFRLHAHAEVIAHTTQALELGEHFPEQRPPYARLYLLRGRSLELSNRHRQAVSNYLELEELARQRGDREMLLEALTAHAIVRANPTPVHDDRLAKTLCEQALDLAWELNDQAAAAKLMWAQLLVNVRAGRPGEAVFFGERALSLAREYNMKELLGYTLNDISQAYFAAGQVQRGREALVEAKAVWEELENLPMLADCLGTTALFDYFLGHYERSIQGSEEALKIGRRIGNAWSQAYAQMYLGNVYHEIGQTGRAIQVMQECLGLAEEAQFVAPLVNTCAELGKIYASMGLLDRGRELVEQAMEIAGQYTMPWFPWVLTERAQYLILAGDFAGAEEDLARAGEAIRGEDRIGVTGAVIPLVRSELALLKKEYEQVLKLVQELEPYRSMGIRTYIADLDYRHGQALFGLGRVEEARRVLSAAAALAQELGSRRILWRILKALGDVERVRGDLKQASRHWHASAEIVDYISAGLDDEELKAAFLNLPQVRAVYREKDAAEHRK